MTQNNNLLVPNGKDVIPVKYWHMLDSGDIQCDLCPRHCKLKPGQQGLCYVRGRVGDEMVLSTYGRSSGFCIDPIEKKPLNHFLPGTPVLSFGTAGCNLSCKFCQNWDISKARESDKLADQASPEHLANAAVQTGCRSVAYTYNDPVIFLEYARDVAIACKEKGVKSVAVSAGYISDGARQDFFEHMDAANIDLKSFNDDFYYKLCGGHLQPVLETLKYLYHEANVWFEITTLLIPGENDSNAELHAMTEWIVQELGPDVPVHFSAFHPDWKMRDKPNTPPATLTNARNIALSKGLRYVYTGNVHDSMGSSTYCPSCKYQLIERDWYELGRWHMKADHEHNGSCSYCGTKVAGVFEEAPGKWGRHRQPVRLIAN